MHQNAMPAAMASMAAHEQGKFWEYHDILFANQQKLDAASLVQYAKKLGLNVSQFQQTLTSQKYKASIEADAKEAESLGATGTPAFFINGHFISGARPFADFAKLIDAELQKLNLPVPNHAGV